MAEIKINISCGDNECRLCELKALKGLKPFCLIFMRPLEKTIVNLGNGTKMGDTKRLDICLHEELRSKLL